MLAAIKSVHYCNDQFEDSLEVSHRPVRSRRNVSVHALKISHILAGLVTLNAFVGVGVGGSFMFCVYGKGKTEVLAFWGDLSECLSNLTG